MIVKLLMEALIIIYNNPFGPGPYLGRNPKISVAQTIIVLGYFSFLPIKILSSCDSAISTTFSAFITQEDKKTGNYNTAEFFIASAWMYPKHFCLYFFGQNCSIVQCKCKGCRVVVPSCSERRVG